MDIDERRRHGDIFPLPLRTLTEQVAEADVPFSQRAYWIGQTLNKLAMHESLNSRSSSVLCSGLPLTAAQRGVADRIAKSLSMHGECPGELTPEQALQSMRGSLSSYEGIPSNLAAYSHDRLKILEKGTCPQHIVQFLPPEAAVVVKNFRSTILRTPVPETGSFSPYWDPGLRFSRKMRLDFISRLFQAGLMTLRPVASSFVGAFCVKKKDPRYVRLVIDCRGTNMLHQDPPVTRLGSSRCYGDLELDNCGHSCAWGREADVSDCFYRFSLPELSDFFAIDEPLQCQQRQQMGISADFVFDPREQKEVRTSPTMILFPCFKVVPMGWTWALWLCNEAVLNIALKNSPWNDGILRERKPTPQLSEHKTILGVYVDNITILGNCPEDVDHRARALQAAFDEAGIPILWTQDSAVDELESVGLVLKLRDGIVMNKPGRVWKFYLASLALLRRKKIKGDVLQVWAGHFTSLCGITPFGLSALQHVYRFINIALHKKVTVWSSVKKEIRDCASLVWLTWKQLNAPFLDVVEVGDSSTSGYALCACRPPQKLIRRAARYHERWRFIPMPQALRDEAERGSLDSFLKTLSELLGDDTVQDHKSGAPFWEPYGSEINNNDATGLGSAIGPSTQYAQDVFDSLREGSYLATSAIRSQIRAKGKQRMDIEVPALVEPLHEFFADSRNYRLLWCRRWANSDEHITLKEARVALSSLRRSTRAVSTHGFRKLTLSDNLPCICAFSKGRSSNHRLNRLCQTAASLQFSSGISWTLRHIETKRNISDGPSRAFERHRGTRAEPFFAVPSESGSGLSREASTSSKPYKPRREHVENVFPCSSGKFFLEIFSGCGNLSKAVQQLGIPTLEPLDYIHGSHADLRRRRTQQLVFEWLDRGLIGFVHLGTPCTIWSRARHNVRDSHTTRCKEETGIELALFSCEVIKRCIANGIPYALENPRTSKLFLFPHLLRAVASGPFNFVDWEMCQYGEKYKKSTRIVTSVDWLQSLCKRCHHRSHEVRLQGKVKSVLRASPQDNAGAKTDAGKRKSSALVTSSSSSTLGGWKSSTTSLALEGPPSKRGKTSSSRSHSNVMQPLTLVESILSKVKPERRLRVRRIGPTTLVRYDSHVTDFSAWCQQRRRGLGNERQVDVSMSIYFNHLVDDGASVSVGTYTFYGWIALRMVPSRPERDLLPLARAALAAWKTQSPGTTRVGVPPQVVYSFACFCVHRGDFHVAVAALLQYDLYARPTEILGVTTSDLVKPVRNMTKIWGVVFGNSDRDARTKTGVQDDVVMANSSHRPWCGQLLQHISRCRHQTDHFVFEVSLSQYEARFRDFSRAHSLSPGTFTPHTLRHSGPSFDAIHQHRTLNEIQQRGRWAAASSVTRYKKPGRLLLQASRLPCEIQRFDLSRLQRALTTILNSPWVLGAPLTLP
eukprot:Skav227424  [mRNA]  locus=scaffold1986:83849:88250:+ [translate_table: standard]